MEQLISGGADTAPDVDMNNFMAEVIDGSAKQPVVVQFWARYVDRKQLGPVLKGGAAAKGKVRMVVDIDQNQQIAAQLRVQSVPTVYAFFNGQPVDALPVRNLSRRLPNLRSWQPCPARVPISPQ